MAIIGTDSTFRDEWLTGAARAFFVSAYADAVESGEDDFRDLPRAGGGEDWADVAPEPPIAAYALAGELWGRLEAANGLPVAALAMKAAIADGATEDTWIDAIDADEFGSSLAMQAMGHGVSWFDDHKEFPIVVPHVECSAFTFDPSTYGSADGAE